MNVQTCLERINVSKVNSLTVHFFDLRNAFKTNAWMQISHLSVDQAKELYIETIDAIIKEEK
jgi:acyl-CoA-binding protein